MQESNKMFYSKLITCIISCIVVQIQSAKLPSYLPPCTENDPNFDDCAKASIKTAIPHILNGDPKYHIPKLNPLELSEVKIASGELELTLANIKIHGVEAVKEVDEFHWDKEANIVSGAITLPEVELIADYKISGRILVLPITGQGPANLKLDNCKLWASYPIEMIPQEDGSRKLEIKKGSVKYTVSHAAFQMDNLFGDKALSENMNKLLNDNWSIVVKDLGEAIPITMEEVFRQIATGVFNKIAV